MLVDNTYFPIFCAKSGDLTTEQDEIEVSSVNSGTDREYIPGMANHTFSCAGLVELDNTGGRISLLYLMQQSVRRQTNQFRVLLTDKNGNMQVLGFNAFVKGTSLAKQAGSYGQATASFRITGPISYGSAVPPPVDPVCEIADPLYLTLGVGATFVFNALLQAANVEILGVWRSGTALVYTNGTPINDQYSYDPATGRIYVSSDNPGNGEAFIVLYKTIG